MSTQMDKNSKAAITEETDIEKRKRLANQYIQSIKSKQDTIALADAYLFLSEAFSHSTKAVSYADSIIQLTKHLKDNPTYPAEGYLQKGIQLYYTANYDSALKNYLLADAYYKNEKNELKQLIIKHYIGLLKNNTNERDEALLIFKENIKFFDSEENRRQHKRQYLKSLYALATAYVFSKELDSAVYFSKTGINESLQQTDRYLYPHFLFAYGGALFWQKHYKASIDSFAKGLSLIPNKKISVCMVYINISTAYDSLGNQSKTFEYLHKVDSIYHEEPQVVLQAEEAYQTLLKKYQQSGNTKKQLEIINKLLAVERVIKKRPKNLSRKIVEHYETPRLLEEKERLISVLKKENDRSMTYIAISGTMGVALFLLFIRYYQRDKRNKRRFEELMQTTNTGTTQNTINPDQSVLDISETVVKDVLHKLRKFEQDKGFLDPGLTAVQLAAHLDTNSKYLTKIIKYHKKQSFIYYINNLRIDTIVVQLKENPKLRNYTLKALAEEAGFNSTDVFSKYFNKRTGISPSYFIKQLRTAKKIS
ncbi:helix-turn-helix domain-containing protein [Aquimarina brevivitae]|nr:helix-turn-helix domain-containing protein [Aquimarina brevivitae]